MLNRAGLVAIDRLYRFVGQNRHGHFVVFPKSCQNELRIIQGLVLLCAERRLSLPPAPVVFCSDSSIPGYALAVSS
eukprot:9840907-Heterocapsa_arctica.AAC.1